MVDRCVELLFSGAVSNTLDVCQGPCTNCEVLEISPGLVGDGDISKRPGFSTKAESGEIYRRSDFQVRILPAWMFNMMEQSC